MMRLHAPRMRLEAYERMTGDPCSLEVLQALHQSQSCLQVVDITQEQMAALCGNVLELEDGRGLPVLAMSSQVCATCKLLLTGGCCSA